MSSGLLLSSRENKDFLHIHRVTAITPCANGRNVVGQQLPTTRFNMQQGVQPDPTCNI